MNVEIDLTLCQGHGMCRIVAPDLFKQDTQEGQAYVDDPHVPPDFEDAAERAEGGCPEQAITLLN